MDIATVTKEVYDPDNLDAASDAFAALSCKRMIDKPEDSARLGRKLRKGDGLGLYETFALIQDGVSPDLDEVMVADFLNAYALTGQKIKAAAAIGVWPTAIAVYARHNPRFAMAMVAAREIAMDIAEDELLRRGLEGTTKTIYYQGNPCGEEKVYSDTALLRVLEANRPERWKKRIANEHTGDKGAPIEIDVARNSLLDKLANARPKQIDVTPGETDEPSSE